MKWTSFWHSCSIFCFFQWVYSTHLRCVLKWWSNVFLHTDIVFNIHSFRADNFDRTMRFLSQRNLWVFDDAVQLLIHNNNFSFSFSTWNHAHTDCDYDYYYYDCMCSARPERQMLSWFHATFEIGYGGMNCDPSLFYLVDGTEYSYRMCVCWWYNPGRHALALFADYRIKHWSLCVTHTVICGGKTTGGSGSVALKMVAERI